MNDNKNGSVTPDSYKADYDDLASGVNVIETAVRNINDCINECNKVITEIFTEETFFGPFADYCLGTWQSLSSLTVDSSSLLKNSASVLASTAENYKASDTDVSGKVGSV